MRIALIGHTERSYLPFLQKYQDFFERHGHQTEVFFWEREAPVPPVPGEHHFYRSERGGKADKLAGYLSYRRYLTGLLGQTRYDRLVLLTTLPAVLLHTLLRREYAGRYLLDIRDYSFEDFPPYRRLVGQLMEGAFCTVLSSDGFRRFLPDNPRLVLNHNLPARFPTAEAAAPLPTDRPLCIGFVGLVRYFNQNAALLSGLANHPRFTLCYRGKPIPGCDLQGFCAANGIANVRFAGKYENTDKAALYRDIDLVNALYGAGSKEVTTALPNRLYEACLLKKPLLTSSGTYLSEVVEQEGLGLALDAAHDPVLPLLTDWCARFSPTAFSAACDRFLARVYRDEANFYDRLRAFTGH